MSCTKCSGETTLRSGISKKTGKRWNANVCSACGNFDFIKGDTPTQKPISKPQTNLQEGNLEILTTLTQILLVLEQIEKNTRQGENAEL